MFQDKTAIVTGGAGGIGQSLCEELGRRGAIVVIADIAEEAAKRVADSICDAGGQAAPFKVDITSEKEVQQLVDQTISLYGRVDFMFNNAGATIVGEGRDLTMADWHRVVDTNLWGAIHGTHAAYRAMVAQGFGHICNTSSGFGLTPAPALAPYVASKHAIVGLSECLRIEGADLGVRVSVACPGYVRTTMLKSQTAVNLDGEKILDMIPFKLLEPAQCAAYILKGVEKNKAVIAFPFYVRAMAWSYHFMPSIAARFGLRMIRDLRKIRIERDATEATQIKAQRKLSDPGSKSI